MDNCLKDQLQNKYIVQCKQQNHEREPLIAVCTQKDCQFNRLNCGQCLMSVHKVHINKMVPISQIISSNNCLEINNWPQDEQVRNLGKFLHQQLKQINEQKIAFGEDKVHSSLFEKPIFIINQMLDSLLEQITEKINELRYQAILRINSIINPVKFDVTRVTSIYDRCFNLSTIKNYLEAFKEQNIDYKDLENHISLYFSSQKHQNSIDYMKSYIKHCYQNINTKEFQKFSQKLLKQISKQNFAKIFIGLDDIQCQKIEDFFDQELHQDIESTNFQSNQKKKKLYQDNFFLQTSNLYSPIRINNSQQQNISSQSLMLPNLLQNSNINGIKQISISPSHLYSNKNKNMLDNKYKIKIEDESTNFLNFYQNEKKNKQINSNQQTNQFRRINIMSAYHEYLINLKSISQLAESKIPIHPNFEGKIMIKFINHKEWVSSLDYNPISNQLCSGSADLNINIYDFQNFNLLYQFTQAHEDQISAIHYLPYKFNILCSGSFDSTIKLWNPLSFFHVQTIQNNSGVNSLLFLDFLDFSELLASANEDNQIKLYDLQKLQFEQQRYQLKGHTNNVKCLTKIQDLKLLASGSWDRTVRLWDLRINNNSKSNLIYYYKIILTNSQRNSAFKLRTIRLDQFNRLL